MAKAKTKKKTVAKTKKKTSAPRARKNTAPIGWVRSVDQSKMLHYRDGDLTLEIPVDMYDRARKKIGLSDDTISHYTKAADLKQYLDAISPKTNPDARVKAAVIPDPSKAPAKEKVPAKVEFESKLEVKFAGQNRAQFDENNLQAKLREINRKYGAQAPKRIVLDKNCKVVKGKNELKVDAQLLITKITIYY